MTHREGKLRMANHDDVFFFLDLQASIEGFLVSLL